MLQQKASKLTLATSPAQVSRLQRPSRPTRPSLLALAGVGGNISATKESTEPPAKESAVQTPELPECKPQAPAKKVKKAVWDAGQTKLLSYYRALCQFQGPSLHPSALLRLGITVEELDLSPNRFNDNHLGPRFIKPVTRVQIEKFIRKNKPWRNNPLHRIRKGDALFQQRPNQRALDEDLVFEEGRGLLLTLQAFGQTTSVDNNSQWYNKTWMEEINEWYPLHVQDDEDFHTWSVDSILEPCDEGANPQSTPHVQAFVQSSVPLEEDRLSTGEMAVATGLLTVRRCYQGYNGHRYIPVTIFYASFRKLRVLQVWHDKNEPARIYVRKSPVMDFMRGERANRREWINVLCWMMGDPVIEDVSNASSATQIAYAGKQ